MRKNIFAIAISFIILLSFFVIYSCEEEETNHKPTCTITSPVQDSTILKGEIVTITAISDDEDGNLKEVRFYIDNNGVGSTSTFPYTYQWNTSETSLGTHTLKAEAIDDKNAKAESSVSIEIIDNALTANFIADKTIIALGDTINFSDMSETIPYEWNWSFGDGKSSTEQNPSHKYSNAGIYNVSLTVKNDFSTDSETKSNYITVQTTPTIATTNITEYSSTTAKVGGSISSDGYSDIIDCGIYYGTTSTPEINGVKFSIEFNDNNFSDTITGLEINTTYYIRAYATNPIGTKYGNTVSFTTGNGLPVLSTSEILSITSTSAIGGGEITDDGDFDITARGVCWSINSNPTISDNKTVDGTGTGSFNSNITNLEVSTTYYIRAYATNTNGTSYGAEYSFTTEDGLPTIITTEISNITATSAESGGSITDNGGFEITARGVCWSTNSAPSVSDNYSTDGNGLGGFISNLSGLSEWSTYYVRAYATNINGTTYGNEIEFIARNTIKDYDGNIYGTVTIGTQTWMTENLKTTHYSDGTEISLVESTATWTGFNELVKAYCYYNNSSNNGANYGALYTWAAALNGITGSSNNPSGIQGVCPIGWHIPSLAEWNELRDYLSNNGYSGIEGSALKSTSGWYNEGNGTDNYYFSALPGGARDGNGAFIDLNKKACFWSTTLAISPSAYYSFLNYLNSNLDQSYIGKSTGFSVRCVKD